MTPLDRALLTLTSLTTPARGVAGDGAGADERRQLLVTLVYLGLLLSVPLDEVDRVLLFAIYPVAAASLSGPGYWRVFVRSLPVLPFIVFIAVFNPLFDTALAFRLGGVEVSHGWVTFASVTVRGLLAVQAVVILVGGSGYNGVCRAFGRLGMPAFMVTQLLLVNRYLIVLLTELQTINRARLARSWGRRLPARQWGMLVGRLFINSVDRAQRIHRAMLARGFDGRLRTLPPDTRWRPSDTAALLLWTAVLATVRFAPFRELFASLAA